MLGVLSHFQGMVSITALELHNLLPDILALPLYKLCLIF